MSDDFDYQAEKDAEMETDYYLELAEEEMQERCPHEDEDLYVNEITVKIQSKPYGDTHDGLTKEDWFRWQDYLAKHGTQMFELNAEVVCQNCGASQEQYIDIETMLETKKWWVWEE